MFDNESEVYDELVTNQNIDHLLESLLAYHFYRDARKQLIYTYVDRFNMVPSEDFLLQILTKQDNLEEYKANAHSELLSQVRIILDNQVANKKETYFERVVNKAILDFAANSLTYTVKFIIFLLILYVATTLGIIGLIKEIIQLFPSIREKICE